MFDGIVDELSDAATKYYDWWREVYGKEAIYSYGFYTTPLIEWVEIVVFTDEGLRKVADAYRAATSDASQTIESLMNDLRWSPADSPHCMENGAIFSVVNERFFEIRKTTYDLDPHDPAFNRHMQLLHDCLISALLRFRAGALGGAREPLLSVWCWDQSEKEIESFIERCNDKEMLAWYRVTCSQVG